MQMFTSEFQVFSVCDFQSMAHGEDLRCSHFLFPDFCHLHGMKVNPVRQ